MSMISENKKVRQSALRTLLFVICSLFISPVLAQDPVIMTVNGKPVPRSEFEYSYKNNNSEGVIDKKSVY